MAALGLSCCTQGFLQLWQLEATLELRCRASHCGGGVAWAPGMRASAAVARGLGSCGSGAPEHRLGSCGSQA